MRIGLILIALATLGLGILVYSWQNLEPIDWEFYLAYVASNQDNSIDSVESLQQSNYSLARTDVQQDFAMFYQLGTLTNYLNLDSILVLNVSLFLIIAGYFGALHTLIDKLFFCKFHENPDYVVAIKRGFLLASMIPVYFFIALQNYLEPLIGIVVFAAFVVMELFTNDLIRQFRSKNNVTINNN